MDFIVNLGVRLMTDDFSGSRRKLGKDIFFTNTVLLYYSPRTFKIGSTASSCPRDDDRFDDVACALACDDCEGVLACKEAASNGDCSEIASPGSQDGAGSSEAPKMASACEKT